MSYCLYYYAVLLITVVIDVKGWAMLPLLYLVIVTSVVVVIQKI